MKHLCVIGFFVLGMTGQSAGFLDALLGLLGGGSGGFRMRQIGPFSGGGFMGPIIPRRRRVFEPLPRQSPLDVQYGTDPYNEDPHHHDCQEPGAPKCQVGYECVTVSSIKSREEHLCTRNHVGHCECAAGCMHKNRFIPLGRHRRPVEIDQCEWCQCLQHHDHGHADCFKDCSYNPIHEHRDTHYHH